MSRIDTGMFSDAQGCANRGYEPVSLRHMVNTRLNSVGSRNITVYR